MKKIVCLLIIIFIGLNFIPNISGNLKTTNNLLEMDFIINNSEEKYLFDNEPKIEWLSTFGGQYFDRGDCVQQTTNGGFIITGSSESFGSGNYDVWMIKTDSNGTEEWNKTYGGLGYDNGLSVQQTTDGGFIIAGGTTSYAVGSRDVWLIKTDADGNEEWNKTYGGTNFDSGESVQQTADGGYVIIGQTSSYGDGMSDAWLIKTDSNGSLDWDKTYGGFHYDYGWSGIQTSDGGYMIVGRTESFGAGHGDFWIIKTDGYGNKIWDETFGTGGFESAHSVQETSDGAYITAGFTNSYGAGWYDIWLIKMSSVGTKVWEKTYGGLGGDTCGSVWQTFDGGFIIAGGTYSYGLGNSDFWVIKTDAEGNENWNRTFGGSNYDCAESVKQTTEGGYIVAGRTGSFGAGDSDLWLIKIETENNPPYEPSEPIPENNSVSVDIEINLSWSGGDPDGDNVTYDVYFGDYNPPPKVVSNQTDNYYNPGILDFGRTYYWQIFAWDNKTLCTKGQIWSFTTNFKPEGPDISGPTNGLVGTAYTYTFNSVDLDDDDVFYYIKWGDGHVEIWDGPHHSGEDFEISHTYLNQGTFTIEAKAKDINGAESNFTTLEVNIPRFKQSTHLLRFRLLYHFPNLFSFIKNFLFNSL
ncbi:MAG: hypothetical protein JSU91_05355 [Thermoplasmatales archaeon]|nr:MAG: hypothetical protein JSU91_05355 [Thermoplasmatales archaeon]